VEEVRGLAERYGAEAVRSFPGIGYREIGEMIYGTDGMNRTDGTGTAEVKSDIMVATRQYAKRQLTWFAREPNLERVMLTGNEPFFTVVPSLF
jgi:tRNA A37 N6-isopentenylltransferase MiaA